MAVTRTKRKPMADINVVPYIDVMLVLLVIFMITAPMLTQGVQVELPKTASEPVPSKEEEPLVVTVDRDGAFFLNVGDNPNEAVDSDVLVARVAAVLRRKPQIPVYVRGDTRVDYGKVVVAMALLQSAGAQSVGLLTEPPVQKR